MVSNHLTEIKEAFESGDMNRTHSLIQKALREKPTPQLYRLAAELAGSPGEKTLYLEKAKEFEGKGAEANTEPTSRDTTTARSCQHCKALNPSENTVCANCGRSMTVSGVPLEEPVALAGDRGGNKGKVISGIIIVALCLWAAGLVYVGVVVFRGDIARRFRGNQTATALAVLESTPTNLPNATLAPTSIPTQVTSPTSPILKLEAGRVTSEDYNFYNITISPGHRTIAAAIEIDGNWQIVEVDPVSGLITRGITDQDHVYTNPHYSDDGGTLLLRANFTGNNNIHLVDSATGYHIQTLTNYGESVGYPRWMPDNHSFLYKRYTNQDAEVFIGYLDGSSPTQLTNNDRYDGSPTSAPDGRTIAMSSFINGNYEIVVLNRDTGEFRQLTFHSGRDSEPVFSPDSAWIIFESDRGGDYNIWAIRPDGTGLRQVTTDDRNELIPAFSPDGAWLYFQQRQGNGNFSINRIPWP